MKQLIIVRHGDAGPYTQPDAARALSELGRAQADKAAAHLQSLGWSGIPVWHSPFVRAQQTAEIIGQAVSGECNEVEGITPDDSPDTLIRQLDREDVPDRLVVVSHMPLVAALVARLTSERADPFMTGEARLLETDTIWYPGQASLVRVMRPL